jgi:hypothetical protein
VSIPYGLWSVGGVGSGWGLLLHRLRSSAPIRSRASIPIATPTPMPALAPVERPSGGLFMTGAVVAGPVVMCGLLVVVDTKSAAWKRT